MSTASPCAAPVRVRPRRPFELMRLAAHDSLGFMERLAREGGDLAYIHLGPRRIYVASHPDLLQELLVERQPQLHKGFALQIAKDLLGNGLLTSEGAYHRQQRKLVLPAFHHSRLRAYADVMTAYAARRAATWTPDQPFDLAAELRTLTLEIVGATLFNDAVGDEAREISAALDVAMGFFDDAMSPLYPLLNLLPLPSTRRFNAAKARLDTTVYRFIAAHRASGDVGDVLSMLIAAWDKETGAAMDDTAIRDEAMTLFLAGHETTAAALAWTCYLLAQHPDVEARLVAECQAVLGDRLPTFDDLPALDYTRRVLTEAMRLYPPAYVTSREVQTPITLGGHRIPRRATVVANWYSVHHDARFYPDPERFDPDRWTPEAKAARPKFAYLPFGAGVRVCIGEQFAWMEGILVLATLLPRWRFRLDAARPVGHQAYFTLRPWPGIWVTGQLRAFAPTGPPSPP